MMIKLQLIPMALAKNRELTSCVGSPKRQSGQALIELAFLMPILMGLCVGVIELGRYAYVGILIGNAARGGSAYGSQTLPQSVDTTGIANAAKYDFAGTTSGTTKTNGQLVSALTVTSAVSCGCDSAGSVTSATCDPGVNPNAGKCTGGAHWVVVVSVTASGTFNALFRYPWIPTSINVARTSSMRVAQS
jgi:Flp pilus assembly protein TadG